jgi:hypothetical protein
MVSASDRLDETMGGRVVEIAKPPFSPRRTVYGNIDRQDLPNLFRVFDIASPDSSNPRRARTTVPQQSLFLMNSPFSIEQGRALAARATSADPNDTEARLNSLFKAAYGRSPTVDEIGVARALLEEAGADNSGSQLNPWEQLAQLLLMTNEFAYVD